MFIHNEEVLHRLYVCLPVCPSHWALHEIYSV
uniref:Uncharacterized protein n=1 Tax=Anguilla anguilla TaxID=7936 RepID=A0A0E9QG89_ANGAN